MSTKHKDPMAATLPGPSNEEIAARDAEIRAKREATGFPKVEFVRDGSKPNKPTIPYDNEKFDGTLESWGDVEFDPLGANDPLTSAVEAHRKPGMAYKLMSGKVTDHLGTQGYRPVIDKSGDVVRVGNMFLGTIPEVIAEKRRRHWINETQDEMRGIKDKRREEVEKLKDKAKDLGIRVLEEGEMLTSESGQKIESGIHVERGEDLAA